MFHEVIISIWVLIDRQWCLLCVNLTMIIISYLYDFESGYTLIKWLLFEFKFDRSNYITSHPDLVETITRCLRLGEKEISDGPRESIYGDSIKLTNWISTLSSAYLSYDYIIELQEEFLMFIITDLSRCYRNYCFPEVDLSINIAVEELRFYYWYPSFYQFYNYN